jgi:hypothetical protein
MLSAACQQMIGQWLLDSGVEQLELLFRTIIYQPADASSSRIMTVSIWKSVPCVRAVRALHYRSQNRRLCRDPGDHDIFGVRQFSLLLSGQAEAAIND